jgi:hypothetical protein
MNKKLRRENHYLLQCYQKAFADSDGHVWVKYSDQSEPERRNPQSVGLKRNLYVRSQSGREDDDVETFFGEEVEDTFAGLSQRIKNEREAFSQISPDELASLLRFVACQTVRTLGHKRCVDEQAGGTVPTNTFVNVMLRQMLEMTGTWLESLADFHFYTSVPNVGERFITGDNPVVVIVVDDATPSAPGELPRARITDLAQLLKNPNCGFWLSLSPYVCVSIHGHGDLERQLPPEPIEPAKVRLFNDYVRGQSKIFTLAGDRESLISRDEARGEQDK